MHSHRSWAEINPAALRHNLGVVREKVGPTADIMAVVKAHAYGHDVELVVPAIRELVQMFAVANVTEAKELRTLCAHEILILGPALPEERPEIVAAGFMPVISSLGEAHAYAALGRTRAHLVVDTGMGRIGVWQDDFEREVEKILRVKNLEIVGIATHLPVPDEDVEFTQAQLERFQSLVEKHQIPTVNALNSAGILRFPQFAGGMVRAGLMIYGSSPLHEFQPLLQPVMTWKTRVVMVRDVGEGRSISYGRTFITPGPMRVATLAAGYADGYHRTLSNRGASVLIRGQRCPLLGRVTMDQIMVDVSGLSEVELGDEAVLVGRQGDEEILAGELAQLAGTIAWEIMTSVSRRVPRITG
ncbi:MAG: alanine racemase [Chthoniobacteraceae bacterium]